MIWENLTIDEFKIAKEESKGTVLVPIGCLEKHGSHMPIGTDIFIARYLSIEASKKESAVVFPFIPFGIVGEVKHKLGTISLSSNLIYHMLDELCNELYRNGFNKIIFVDGHGGNTNFLKYFMQSRLEKYHPYITYYFDAGSKNSEFWKDYQEKFGRVLESGHACEFEASSMMAINNDLMKMDRITPDETKAMHRLDHISNAGLYTGIGWYADYPNQVAGDPTNATIERGQYINEYNITRLVNAIKVAKYDDKVLNLLNEYYDKHKTPEEF